MSEYKRGYRALACISYLVLGILHFAFHCKYTEKLVSLIYGVLAWTAQCHERIDWAHG